VRSSARSGTIATSPGLALRGYGESRQDSYGEKQSGSYRDPYPAMHGGGEMAPIGLAMGRSSPIGSSR
jgi:hypothetical protein